MNLMASMSQSQLELETKDVAKTRIKTLSNSLPPPRGCKSQSDLRVERGASGPNVCAESQSSPSTHCVTRGQAASFSVTPLLVMGTSTLVGAAVSLCSHDSLLEVESARVFDSRDW